MLNAFYVLEPVVNEEGKLVDIRFLNANPAFKHQMGLNTDDIIGKTWTEVYNYNNKNLGIYHKIMLEIATNVTDTFKWLFKKHTGLSPTEYRQKSISDKP